MKPPDWKLPDDPLRFIQACVRNRRVLWTYHVNMRLKGRFIPRKAILDAVESHEIVEAYPATSTFPAIWFWEDRRARRFMSCLLQTWKGIMCGS